MDTKLLKINQTFAIYLLSLLFLISFRLLFRGNMLEIDEAEQVFWVTNLQPGYAGQPPLYSWLQFVLFKILGVNLLSLALLKYSLLLGAIYFYHKICSLYCSSSRISLAASLAWVLIPTIGFDLLKDNTHTILALLFTGLCWYYFISPNIQKKLSKPLWYSGFGLILGLGLLSKFNFAVFFVIFLVANLSIKETRAKFLNLYFIWSLILASLITSPYLYWLIINSHLGFSSMYKTAPPDHIHSNGMASLIKGIVLFSLPVLFLSWAFFSKAIKNTSLNTIPKLLSRYHLIAIPILGSIVLIGGFTNFETRWLIPILFLCPLLFFSKLPESLELVSCFRNFVVFCIVIAVLLLSALIYRSNFGYHYRQKISMMEDIQSFSHANDWDVFMSESMLVLGTFRLQNEPKLLYSALARRSSYAFKKKNYLFFWIGKKAPFWIQETLTHYQLKPIMRLEKPNYGAVLSMREERSR